MRKKLVVSFPILTILLLVITSIPTQSYGQTPPPATSTPTATGQAPVPTPAPDPGDRTFPETGFTVPAVFVRYWEAKGGLAIFGFPISPARVERNLADGKDYLVQYFERNRFEHHPEFKGTTNEVLLGLLGVELTRGRSFETVDPFRETTAKIYLEPTQHSLAEPFLSYWRNKGGLEIFGYPISEPFNEKNPDNGKEYLVQYFQRNRFEFHPENQPPYDVLLGLLGKDYMELQSSITAWGPPIPGGIPITQPLWKPAKPNAGGQFVKGPHVGDGMIAQLYYGDRGRILHMINDLQFTWVKQQVEWKDTEDPKGGYHWDELDRVVNDAQSRNVKVLLSIVKAPEWATGDGHGFPRDPRDLGDFMKAITAHFKGRVGAYEIWNEYNLEGESGQINPGRYVELLKEAYKGVKSVDTSVAVVAGALTPTGIDDPQGKRGEGVEGVLKDTTYLEEMYKYNDGEVRAYFDAMGTHPYGYNNPPDTKWPDNPNLDPAFPINPDKGKPDYYNLNNQFYFRRIEDQRSIMEKYGDGIKQMWVTEYGWCSDFREGGYGDCRFTTQEEQGIYTVAAMQWARKYYPWMGVMFLWNLNFSTFQPWYTGPSHFSIIDGDWTPRPAYNIIKARPR